MNPIRSCTFVFSVFVAAGALGAQSAQKPTAADPNAHSQHAQHPQDPAKAAEPQDLAKEIAALRAQVAQLQAALVKGHAAGGMNSQQPMGGMKKGMGASGMGQQPMQGMPGSSGMSGGGAMSGGGMGMMDMDGMMGGMGGSSGGGMGMMMDNMMKGGGGMKMMGMGDMAMGGMGSPAAAAVPTALPGFPGASRIYHIGSTGFFLDHPEHITLTLEQQTALSQKKEQALLQQADCERKIEQAEQELWVLTGADQPDAAKIDAKVREIAKLQGEQRVAFVRAVGEAATILADEQRKQLSGLLPPQPTAAPAQPMPMGANQGSGMSDM